MDPTTHAHGTNPEQADGHGMNEFYDHINPYSNFPAGQNTDFEFAWNNPPLFDSPDNTSAYGHSNPPAWQHDTLGQQTIDPSIQSYAQPQQPIYRPNQFQHPQYDARRPSQASFDPRSMLRPSHSPVSQPNYQYQQPVSYMNTYGQHHEYGQPPQQPTDNSQRPNVPTPSFSPAPPHNPYIRYGLHPSQQPDYQHMNAGNFHTFQLQDGRPTQSFVDPNLLTANNHQNQPGTQFQNDFQSMQGQVISPSPVTGQRQQALPSGGTTINNASIQPAIAGNVSALATPEQTSKPEKKPAKKKVDPDAPKRPRGRPRKDGSMPQSKVPSDMSPAAANLEVEIEEAPEAIPAPLMGNAPEDPAKRAEWDTLQAVWSPRNKPASIERIRTGIALYGELLKRLRTTWEAQNEVLKKAELSNAPTDDLRRQVTESRNLVERVMITTREWGHPSHIRTLGENHWTILAMRAFLIDRVTATDWDGSLVLNILKVMSQFETLDQEMLDKVKMVKTLDRFSKKSGPEIKALVQRVVSNATAASQQKTATQPPETGTATPPTSSSIGGPVAPNRDSPQLAGTKRPREDALADRPVAKKAIPARVIPEASKPLALQNHSPKKAEVAGKPAKSEQVPNGTSSAAAKTKTVVPVPAPKPVPSVFSALVSASKKPGTSNAARAAAAAKEKAAVEAVPKKEAAPKKESPPPTSAPPSVAAQSRPAFSFAQTLAGLNKPKEVESNKVADQPEETEEDKVKRLRKESRKKLRVSWKPDDSLTEIRLFTHHPDEEVGHADSMTRDMDDVGGEGRMLKMHKDLDEMDEDEEAKAVGEDVNPYRTPSEIEYEGIAEDERNRNFIKRGGTQEPDSPEKAAQEQREETSLMVVYALPSDVPPTPKEPPTADEDENYDPPTPFGEPTDSKVRARERQFYASIQTTNPQQSQPTKMPAMNPETNLSVILGALGGNASQQQQAKPMTDLERTFSMFSQMQQQQQPPPLQQQPQQAPQFDLGRLLAAVQQTQQPQPPAPVVTQAAPTPDLSSILASLQAAQQPQQQQQASVFPWQQQPQPQQSQQPTASYEDYSNGTSRKHGRDDSGDFEPGSESYEERQRKKQHANYKTLPCKFFKEGKCRKGDECTYIHE